MRMMAGIAQRICSVLYNTVAGAYIRITLPVAAIYSIGPVAVISRTLDNRETCAGDASSRTLMPYTSCHSDL